LRRPKTNYHFCAPQIHRLDIRKSAKAQPEEELNKRVVPELLNLEGL